MSDSRLFQLLYYLVEHRQATAPELAARFEVSVRTVYRDIEALSSAGIPIYTEPGRNGGVRLWQSFVLDKALFSEQEKVELLTVLQSMAATGSPLGRQALGKLSALFRVETGRWLEVDFSRWGHHPGDTEKFEALKTAVLQHRTVRILYGGASGGPSRRSIQPLQLCYRTREWYLKAFCLERQDFRLFKLNRILEWELLEERFLPRPYPAQEEGPPPALARLRLRFAAQAAYRVYDEFDPAQVERQPDGSLLVSTELPADAWLAGYLLSFGTQVEVLAPEPLRAAVAQQARAVWESYQP